MLSRADIWFKLNTRIFLETVNNVNVGTEKHQKLSLGPMRKTDSLSEYLKCPCSQTRLWGGCLYSQTMLHYNMGMKFKDIFEWRQFSILAVDVHYTRKHIAKNVFFKELVCTLHLTRWHRGDFEKV